MYGYLFKVNRNKWDGACESSMPGAWHIVGEQQMLLFFTPTSDSLLIWYPFYMNLDTHKSPYFSLLHNYSLSFLHYFFWLLGKPINLFPWVLSMLAIAINIWKASSELTLPQQEHSKNSLLPQSALGTVMASTRARIGPGPPKASNPIERTAKYIVCSKTMWDCVLLVCIMLQILSNK